MAVDPANPLRVLVWALNRNQGDFPASLYLSVDGGSSFTGIAGPWDGQGPIREPLNLLAFAGNTPGTVFLAGPFGNFRSLNGGAVSAPCRPCRRAPASACRAWPSTRR